MKTTPARPAQSRQVPMRGATYAWDAIRGLDPAVVTSVLDFIRKRAWSYELRARRAGLEVDELVNEGVLGALKAAAKFNPDAGANFLTYAAWWIEAAMKEALVRPLVHTPDGAPFAQVSSLDEPLDGDEARGASHQDWQRDHQPGPHELSAAAEDRERVRRALPRLAPRDREVLVRHLGLDGYAPQPLKVVADGLGVTRQRAAQLLDRARHDLRQALLCA